MTRLNETVSEEKDDQEEGEVDYQMVCLPLEADLASRLVTWSAWVAPERVRAELGDAVRERLEQAERVRESRGGWRYDPQTGQLIEEE